MKQKSKREWKHSMSTYRQIFQYNPPYEVVLDGNFIHASVKHKIYLKESLEKLLGGICLLSTTPCVLAELRNLGNLFKGTYLAAKRLRIIKCSHSSPSPPDQCIPSKIGKKNSGHLILGTQDRGLQYRVGKVPGTPIVYIQQGVIRLAPLSKNTNKKLIKINKESEELSIKERRELRRARKERGADIPEAQITNHNRELEDYKATLCMGKRKNAKGPNPLSIKPKINKKRKLSEKLEDS